MPDETSVGEGKSIWTGSWNNELIAAWTGHSHLRIIDNSLGFEEKMKHLIAEIANFLGEPDHMR